jgi:hypothetical protein
VPQEAEGSYRFHSLRGPKGKRYLVYSVLVYVTD